MIANAGSDERKKYIGGKAGDQTGREFGVINWYNRPWNCVLRYPDRKVADEIAHLAKAAAQNNCIGYDQGERMGFYNRLKEASWDPSHITQNCETDCSASTTALVIAAGHRLGIKELSKLNPALTTSLMRRAYMSAGFDCLTEKKYLTSDTWLLPGDVLLYDGHHTAINLDTGKNVLTDTSVLTAVALEVIAGKYGSGQTRRSNLIKAGYNSSMVQAEVNRILEKGM